METTLIVAIVLAGYLVVIVCAIIFLYTRVVEKDKRTSDVKIHLSPPVPCDYELIHTQLPIQVHPDITSSQYFFADETTEAKIDTRRNTIPRIVLDDVWKEPSSKKSLAKKKVSTELQFNSSSQYKNEAFINAFHSFEDVELKLFDGSNDSYSSLDTNPGSPRSKKAKKERISSLKKLQKKLSKTSSNGDEEALFLASH